MPFTSFMMRKRRFSSTMGKVREIVVEMMGVLKSGLSEPELKIVNDERLEWLGHTDWGYGIQNGVTFADPTTVISIQKKALVDDRTLRRIIAHELCHHEEFLVIETGKLAEMGFEKYEQHKETDTHGIEWKKVAARFNAKYGEDFVTEESDKDFVIAKTAKKYEDNKTYCAKIPEIEYLPLTAIHRREMDFRAEVWEVSDEIAQTMDYSEPIEVTAYHYGILDPESTTEATVKLKEGHHRYAAALQTGRTWLPVDVKAINASGEKINALIGLSQKIAGSVTKTASPVFYNIWVWAPGKETHSSAGRDHEVFLKEIGWNAYGLSYDKIRRGTATIVPDQRLVRIYENDYYSWNKEPCNLPDDVYQHFQSLYPEYTVATPDDPDILESKTASPDFGYSQYNDRDKDIAKLTWEIIPNSYHGGFEMYVHDPSIPGPEKGGSFDNVVGQMFCFEFFPNDPSDKSPEKNIAIDSVSIQDPWFGTGLGQMLYDRAIAEAKKEGYDRFWSDKTRSASAESAWSKLKKRYPVRQDTPRRRYVIDLDQPWSKAASVDVAKLRNLLNMKQRIPVEEIFYHPYTSSRWIHDAFNDHGDVEVQNVDVSKVVPGQRWIFTSEVKKHLKENGELPSVIKRDGLFYMWDGHHKTVARMLDGQNHVEMEVIDWLDMGKIASAEDELPPEPGTAPIPAGSVRLYHYTNSMDSFNSIKREGLLASKAHGDGGTGPNEPSSGVWASTDKPGNFKAYFEFYAFPNEISHRANYPDNYKKDPATGEYKRMPEIDQEMLNEWAAGNRHVIMNGDVPVDRIIGAHLPWHNHARYILKDDMYDSEEWLHDPAEADKFERDNCKDEAQALRYVQKMKGHDLPKTAASAIRYFWPDSEDNEDDTGDTCSFYTQAYTLAKDSGLNILRDKDPACYALDGERVVGCLFVTDSNQKFSFDIAVDPKFRNKGIGTKLIDMGIQEYEQRKEAFDDYSYSLDVINPSMKKILEHKGFQVDEDLGNRWVMSKTAGYWPPDPSDTVQYNPKELLPYSEFHAVYIPSKRQGRIDLVSSPKRGSGVGGKLVNEFEQWVLDQGGKEIIGYAWPESVGFWQKMGFTINKEKVRLGGDSGDLVHPIRKILISKTADAKSEDESVGRIKQQLEAIKGIRGELPKHIKYSLESFILEFGKHYYTDKNSFKGKRGVQKQCYMNAYKLMMENPNLTYVEGHVDIGPMSVEHAWCVTKAGIVIDPTLPPPVETQTVRPQGYFGVPFSSKYVMETASNTGVYGILSYTNRNLFSGKIEPEDFLAKTAKVVVGSSLDKLWQEAKSQVDLSKDDGVIDIPPYQIQWELWGPGCVFESIRRGIISWDGDLDDFEESFSWMNTDERHELFLEELKRRIGGAFPEILSYGWEPLDESAVREYTDIGYVIVKKTLDKTATTIPPILSEVTEFYVNNYASKRDIGHGDKLLNILKSHDFSKGQCHTVSEDFARWAKSNYPSAGPFKVISGEMADSTTESPSFHFAVQAGSWVVDLTRRQFDPSAPIITIIPLSQWKREFPKELKTSKTAVFLKNAKGVYVDKEGNLLSPQQIEDFVNIAYKGLDVIFTGEGLRNEADGWYIGVEDDDVEHKEIFHWFWCFKLTSWGRKAFAMGHDGLRKSIKEMLASQKETALVPSQHFYVEVSGKIEQIYEKWGLPKVPVSEVPRILPGKTIKPVDDYHYERSIAGAGNVVKVMLGHPIGVDVTQEVQKEKVARWGEDELDFPCWCDLDKTASENHEYGCIMADVPEDSSAAAFANQLRDSIPDEDLAGEGKNVGHNHVTLRYGMIGNDSRIKEYLETLAPIEVGCGETISFDPSKSSKGAAPIVMPCGLKGLKPIYDKLGTIGEWKQSDFEYAPHITVAFVKPEAAEKYVGQRVRSPETFTIRRIEIRDSDDVSTWVELGERKTAAMSDSALKEFIGVDLDGTLAKSLEDYSDPTRIGDPIPAMIEKVKKAIEDGEEVRVFTARLADKVNAKKIKEAIKEWTKEHVGTALEALNEKLPGMKELWDDKGRQVIENKGKFASRLMQKRAAMADSELGKVLKSLKPQFAAAAQKVYDEWDASDETYGDAEVGFGGICHLIVDEWVDLVAERGYNATSFSHSEQVHVSMTVWANPPERGEDEDEDDYASEQVEVFDVDLNPYNYETGGGYSWKKIPDVTIDPGDISIYRQFVSKEDLQAIEDGF